MSFNVITVPAAASKTAPGNSNHGLVNFNAISIYTIPVSGRILFSYPETSLNERELTKLEYDTFRLSDAGHFPDVPDHSCNSYKLWQFLHMPGQQPNSEVEPCSLYTGVEGIETHSHGLLQPRIGTVR
jgi:hypothetical protein